MQGSATHTSTTPSMTTHGWPTQRSSTTRNQKPSPLSGSAIASFSAHGITVKAVRTGNGACYRSRTIAAALGAGMKYRHQAPQDQLLPVRQTAQSNTSTAPWLPSGPTPSPTPQRTNARAPIRPGSTTTTTTEPIPAAEAKPPSAAFITSVGTAPRGQKGGGSLGGVPVTPSRTAVADPSELSPTELSPNPYQRPVSESSAVATPA